MAFFDQTLLLSSAQAITTTADSTNVYDVTGAGVGVAPSMTFGTNTTTYGADIGNSQGVATAVAVFNVTTAGTGAGTISFGVQAAPNNANNAGTYIPLATSKAFVGTSLVLGAQIILPIPPFELIAPGETLPRFYKFTYTVASTATVSVTAGILLNPPAGYVSTQYANNFVSY